MTRATFDIFASYSQVSVFTAGLEAPFNDWEQEHVNQGFAWREGSVSFATLDEAGTLHCEAEVADKWLPHAEAKRAIRVPFRINGESVEIASISDGVVFKSGALGACALIFETWVDAKGEMQARVTFIRSERPVAPEVLLADDGIHPAATLRMTARPA